MSDYIMDLRKVVGHRCLIQAGASIIVEDKEGCILLQKRGDDHTWAYSGGSVEIDERVEDAAVRELFEETGLEAVSIELLGVFSGREMHHVYPNGDEVSDIDTVFICREYKGELKKQESEVEELRFFHLSELPSLDISHVNKPALRAYLSKCGAEYIV